MVYISKKEIFKEERKDFVIKLFKILEIDGKNNEVCINNLNENVKNKLNNMIEDFKTYYSITNLSLNESIKNRKHKNLILSMLKSTLKQEKIPFEVFKKTIKLEKGKYKSMNIYKILLE
jgi:hypothetical protein